MITEPDYSAIDRAVEKVIAKHECMFRVNMSLRAMAKNPTDYSGTALIATCGAYDYSCARSGLDDPIIIDAEPIFYGSVAAKGFISSVFSKVNLATRLVKLKFF